MYGRLVVNSAPFISIFWDMVHVWDVLLVMCLIEEEVLDGMLKFMFFYWCPSIVLVQEGIFIINIMCTDPYFLQEDRFTGDIDGVRLVKGIIDPFVVCYQRLESVVYLQNGLD